MRCPPWAGEHTSRRSRVYVLGLRVHHGLSGCLLARFGLACNEWRCVELGALLVLDDVGDFGGACASA